MEARVEALDLSGGLTRVLHLVDRPFVSSLTWHMSPPRSLLDICLRERAGRIAAGYWRRLCFVALKAEVFLFEWALLRAENTDAAYFTCSLKKKTWVWVFNNWWHSRFPRTQLCIHRWNRRSIRVEGKHNRDLLIVNIRLAAWSLTSVYNSFLDVKLHFWHRKTPLCANVRMKTTY